MNDRAIRPLLRRYLRSQHPDDSVFVEEMGLCEHRARLDLAVVNGLIHGYEIKSDRDRLSRLADQATVFGKCVDNMTLVVATRHLRAARSMLPRWWGFIEVTERGDSHVLRSRRVPRPNPARDSRALVRLLWKSEARQLLRDLGRYRGCSQFTIAQLWSVLLEAATLDQLADAVRRGIKARPLRSPSGWRQTPNGGSSQLPANR